MTLQHSGTQIRVASEIQFVTRVQSTRIARKSMPCAIGPRLIQGDADVCGTASRGQLCGDHTRVVGHQHIAGTQQTRQIAHHSVHRSVARNMQQPRGIAWADRVLRDAIRWQIEIEIRQPHHAGVGATRRSSRTSGMAISTAQSLPTTCPARKSRLPNANVRNTTESTSSPTMDEAATANVRRCRCNGV